MFNDAQATGRWNRRRFLGAAGAAGSALTLGACGMSSKPNSGDDQVLDWWDHFNALQDLHQKMLTDFSASPDGIPTKYQFMQLQKIGQAIQLAKQSGQQPDVHTTPDLGSPLTLIQAGWFQPLELADDAVKRLGDDTLVDGLHRFDGKLYTFPLFSPRWHNGMLWYQKALLDKVGVEPPKSFDDFRAACKAAKAKGLTGLVAGLKAKNPYSGTIDPLAQIAGFPGINGQEFATGEINYSHDAYLTVFELFDALRADKAIIPGASSVPAIQARLRWAAGEGVFWFEGPFAVGAVNRDKPEIVDRMDYAGMITVDGSGNGQVYRNRAGGAFYLKKDSAVAEGANRLLGEFTTPEYYKGLAGAMDQPPPDLSVVADSPDAHPLYKKLCKDFTKTSFLAPMPVVANAEAATVGAVTKKPDRQLGDVFLGMLNGDITDYRKALTQLSSDVAKERDRAISAAKGKGAEVSLDDYAFGNWKPRTDYTAAMYHDR